MRCRFIGLWLELCKRRHQPHRCPPALVQIRTLLEQDVAIHSEWLPQAKVQHTLFKPKMVVVDLFAGSGNMMFWFQRVFSCPCYGFELHQKVSALTQRNLRAVHCSADVRLLPMDYVEGIRHLVRTRCLPSDALIVFVLDPPWEDSMQPGTGMDLLQTNPPIPTILENIVAHFPAEVLQRRVLAVVHMYYKKYVRDSFDQVLRYFAWAHHRYVNKHATKQGYIFGCL